MTTTAPALAPPSALVRDVMVLDHDPASVPAARARVAQRLAHLPGDLLDDTLLVLSELLGNAVRHGAAATAGPTAASAGGVEVRWALAPGAVHLEVVDGGGGEPRVVDRGERAVSGRGMAIVEALSQSWGTTALDGGRRVVWSTITA